MSQVADGTGDVWTYAYDAAGHLLSVTLPAHRAGLTTSYTYDTGSNPETANALLSITNPDGSQQNFTYDSLGRLSGTSANGGADAITYTYPGEAEVQATDAAGDQTHRLVQRPRPAGPRRGPAGRHFHLPLRQQRQPGQLHQRGRRHLPVYLRPERQPDADRQPARPDRADDL